MNRTPANGMMRDRAVVVRNAPKVRSTKKVNAAAGASPPV
jgi:hypothetical protein